MSSNLREKLGAVVLHRLACHEVGCKKENTSKSIKPSLITAICVNVRQGETNANEQTISRPPNVVRDSTVAIFLGRSIHELVPDVHRLDQCT